MSDLCQNPDCMNARARMIQFNQQVEALRDVVNDRNSTIVELEEKLVLEKLFRERLLIPSLN